MEPYKTSDEFVSVSLYKTGLSITSSSCTEFIDFKTLDIRQTIPPNEECLGNLPSIGVVGMVELGPGFLILIKDQDCVFSFKNVKIWNVTETLILPLRFQLVKDYFEVQGFDLSDNEEIWNADEKDSFLSNRVVDERNEVTPLQSPKSDVLFSKAGVYADDIKSSASLSVSKEPILYDSSSFDYSPASDLSSENVTLHDSIPFSMKRRITLRKSALEDQDGKESLYKDVSEEMLQKFEKHLKVFYQTKDFYYSNQIDLTKEIIFKDGLVVNSEKSNGDSFWFNKAIAAKFNSEFPKFVIQGFVNSIEFDLNFLSSDNVKAGELLLISKRSTRRAGLRYLRRGIDDNSHVANFVQTSQIFILNDFLDNYTLFTKFDIIRGSIPLFFQQNPANLKPVPYLTRKAEETVQVFKTHFHRLRKSYGSIACISLVERSKRENTVGSTFSDLCSQNDVNFSWFDFHKVCKNMQFDNVVKLLDEKLLNSNNDLTIEQQLQRFGFYDSLTQDSQLGVFRINCIDCLDRTNLVQKFISEFILTNNIFEKHCLSIERSDEFQKVFNNLWADNGDWISRQYASTNALKGDYTRTSRRDYKGLLTDAWLTMSRYYTGYISDFYGQCFLEYMLGIQDAKIFEEFESTLNVLDPNDLNDNLNRKTSYLKKVIEDLNVNSEDAVLIGSWSGFESSLSYNNLRLKYDDIALVLTNKMIYLIKHTNGSIDNITKFPALDVSEINYGCYYKSTHTSMSTNPNRNIGMKFILKKNSETDPEQFLSVKFPSNMEYMKVKYVINLISKTCVSATLENIDIITLKEAEKNTNVLDILEHTFKKMVWG